jgi:hypothetical protein
VARTNRWFPIVGAALTIWYVVILIWAVRPLADAVPVGLDPDGRPVSQVVECHHLFADTAIAGTLPVVEPPNEYTRGACTAVQRDARIVFGIDTAVFVLGLGGLVLGWRRVRRRLAIDALPAADGVTAGAGR